MQLVYSVCAHCLDTQICKFSFGPNLSYNSHNQQVPLYGQTPTEAQQQPQFYPGPTTATYPDAVNTTNVNAMNHPAYPGPTPTQTLDSAYPPTGYPTSNQPPAYSSLLPQGKYLRIIDTCLCHNLFV